MDQFEKKRGMVKVLTDMLKKNASDEVGGYSEKKQVTHTPLPKEAPAEKPHMKTSYKAGSGPAMAPKAMEGTTMGNDQPQGMAKGGMVDLSKPYADSMQPASDTHMAEGGMAGSDMSVSDQASRLTEPVSNPSDSAQDEDAVSNLPGAIDDEGAEKDAAQSLHNENMMDEDEDNNSSSFEAFLPRKRKK